MEGLTTRLAQPADAAAIARIYNEGVGDRGATFETEPRTAADVAALLGERGEGYPTVLVERAGAVAQGFREVGVYERHGRLDGAWLIVEKLLGDAAR